jgi:prepilin-type N-terminal cleavage/methylation domain-containing protein
MLKIKNKNNGFSLMETLVTIVIVGMLSAVCATMLIFAYSMFEKIMGSGSASIEYKLFRFKAERVFRNMTSAGPVIMDIIVYDECNDEKGGKAPITAEQEENAIKFDVEYFRYPYDGYVWSKKYTEVRDSNATTKYRYLTCTTAHTHDVATCYSTDPDPGVWKEHVGRSVAVYSCIDSNKSNDNYKRYLMTKELNEETGRQMVVLYSWPVHDDKFPPLTALEQETLYKETAPNVTREVLLSDIKDFQVTPWLSNLYINRIKHPRYENIALVKLYVQLGEQGEDMQYSNDLVFANKSIYGDIDGDKDGIGGFFERFNENTIVP